jgi:hypothetical protein
MTSVTLNKLWINRVDSGEAVSGASGRDKDQSFSMALDVRTYASGRRRAVSTVGEVGSLPFTLVAVNLATKEKLRGWVGLLVQVRDNRGQRWFGVFAGIEVREYMRPDLYAVSFTLLTTTYTEGV